LPYGKGQKLTVSQNCIIILEEFDSSIEKIKQLENLFIFKNDTIHTYVNNKTTEIGQKVQDATSDFVQPDIPLSDPYQYISAKQNSSNNGMDPLKITNEISDIVRTITEDNKSDVLRLRDLLELFQGPVPVRDRIIVATTNNFEQIKSIIPPLFRPGRLTPIKFTYLDWDSLQELCQYYFNNQLNMAPFSITIPTSQITELAIKYVSMAKANSHVNLIDELFDEFRDELIELNQYSRHNESEQVSVNTIKKNTNPLPKPVKPSNNPAPDNQAADKKVEMYAKWMDEKLGTASQSKPVTKTKVNQSAEKHPPTDKQFQRRPVARTKPVQSSESGSEEDKRIRAMAVEKVMNKDRKLTATLSGYNQEELINEYLQTAVVVPQHDNMY
jgi:hypothetical protein